MKYEVRIKSFYSSQELCVLRHWVLDEKDIPFKNLLISSGLRLTFEPNKFSIFGESNFNRRLWCLHYKYDRSKPNINET